MNQEQSEQSNKQYTENEDGSRTFKLEGHIIAFSEEKTEITISEPTGKHFRKIGMPVVFDTEGKFSIDSSKMAAMIESLANLPPNSLNQLKFKEINRISMGIIDFFV